MTSATYPSQAARNNRPLLIPNAQLGMLLFVATEIMFFVALISAYLVIKSKSGIRWVPPSDVVLPVEATAVNTLILLTSGFYIFLAGRAFASKVSSDLVKAKGYFFTGSLMGLVFVAIQGFEWSQLLAHGLTMTSGVFGACFFLLIGGHGLHAMAAVLVLFYTFMRLKRGLVTLDQLRSVQIFWYFIVGIWPFLYVLVYL